MNTTFIHPNAIVETNKIGHNTKVWAFVHILKGAEIGDNCNICDHCYIEYNVKIGNNVTVKCGIYLWEGVTLEDDVFLGPNVVFTNNPRPRSKQYIEHLPIMICKGASVGANSTILGGVTVGKYAMSGIGSVITKDVPDYALVYGNPATIKGWVDENGQKLNKINDEEWISLDSVKYKMTDKGLRRV